MKNIDSLKQENGTINVEELRQTTISNIKDLLSHNKQISVHDILEVGVLEDGMIQFKVPKLIKDRQVIHILAYSMWFYNIKPGELE